MRFMLIRKADNDTEAGVMPSQKLLGQMGKYMEDMTKAGVLLAGEGLQPTSKGARIRFSKGKPSVVEGPFAESRGLVAGYFMIQVKSREEAIEWARRWPAIDGDGEVELEIRQVFEAEDFGEEFTPEMREREARQRAQAEQRAKSTKH